MGIIRVVLGVILAWGATANAQSEALTKEQRLKAIREAMGSSRGDGAERPGRSSRVESKAPVDYRSRALEELKVGPEAYSLDPRPRLATVVTQEIRSTDPIYYQGLQVGLTAQSYRPRGTVPLVGLGERRLDDLPSTILPGLELRYMPWVTEVGGRHLIGFRTAASYAAQGVKLVSPTGKDLGPTKLHSLQASLFLSQEWVWTARPSLSAALDLGVGRFDLIQSGTANVAQASSGLWLSLLRVGPAYRIGPVWLSVMYEARRPLSRGWARVADDAVLAGVQYAVR